MVPQPQAGLLRLPVGQVPDDGNKLVRKSVRNNILFNLFDLIIKYCMSFFATLIISAHDQTKVDSSLQSARKFIEKSYVSLKKCRIKRLEKMRANDLKLIVCFVGNRQKLQRCMVETTRS